MGALLSLLLDSPARGGHPSLPSPESKVGRGAPALPPTGTARRPVFPPNVGAPCGARCWTGGRYAAEARSAGSDAVAADAAPRCADGSRRAGMVYRSSGKAGAGAETATGAGTAVRDAVRDGGAGAGAGGSTRGGAERGTIGTKPRDIAWRNEARSLAGIAESPSLLDCPPTEEGGAREAWSAAWISASSAGDARQPGGTYSGLDRGTLAVPQLAGPRPVFVVPCCHGGVVRVELTDDEGLCRSPCLGNAYERRRQSGCGGWRRTAINVVVDAAAGRKAVEIEVVNPLFKVWV
jgi:hypothetical protein